MYTDYNRWPFDLRIRVLCMSTLNSSFVSYRILSLLSIVQFYENVERKLVLLIVF